MRNYERKKWAGGTFFISTRDWIKKEDNVEPLRGRYDDYVFTGSQEDGVDNDVDGEVITLSLLFLMNVVSTRFLKLQRFFI